MTTQKHLVLAFSNRNILRSRLPSHTESLIPIYWSERYGALLGGLTQSYLFHTVFQPGRAMKMIGAKRVLKANIAIWDAVRLRLQSRSSVARFCSGGQLHGCYGFSTHSWKTKILQLTAGTSFTSPRRLLSGIRSPHHAANMFWLQPGASIADVVNVLIRANDAYLKGTCLDSDMDVLLTDLAKVVVESDAGVAKVEDLLAALQYTQHLSDASCPAVGPFLSVVFEKAAVTSLLSGVDLSLAFSWLKNKSDSSSDIRRIICILTTQLESSICSPEQLCVALTGLQSCRSQHVEIRDAVACISRMLNDLLLDDPTARLPLSILCDAMYSLKHMKSDVDEVCVLLKVLALPMYQSRDLPLARDLSRSYFGLQSMNNSVPEVGAVLSVLNSKLIACDVDSFTPADVAMSIYGLKSMRAKREAKSVLKSFSGILKQIRQKDPHISIHIDDITMILYGLKNMSNDSKEVTAMVSEIAVILQDQAVNDPIFCYTCKAEHISSILHALKTMHYSGPEINSLFEAIVIILDKIDISFNIRDAMRGLAGLKGLDGSSLEVRQLITTIRRKMFPSDINQFPSNSLVVNTAYMLRNLMDSAGNAGRTLFIDLCNCIRTDCTRDDSWDLRLFSKLIYSMPSFSNETSDLPIINASIQRLVPRKLPTEHVGGTQCGLTMNSIGNALLGLEGLPTEAPVLTEILSILATATLSIVSTGSVIAVTPHCIVNIFRGIMYKGNGYPETADIFCALANPFIWSSSGRFTTSQISSCFHSMSNLATCSTDGYILSSLLLKARECAESEWSMTDICRSVYGLQSMNPHRTEVKDALHLLSTLLAKSFGTGQRMNVDDALMALEALGKMHSNYAGSTSVSNVMCSLYGTIERTGLCTSPNRVPLSLLEAAQLLSGAQFAGEIGAQFKLLSGIVEYLQPTSHSSESFKAVASILSSLRKIGLHDRNYRTVNKLLSALSSCFNVPVSCDTMSRHILLSLVDLVALGSQSAPSLKLLNNLLQQISEKSLCGDDLSHLIRGLQHFTLDKPAVNVLLTSIQPLLDSIDMSAVEPRLLCEAIQGLRQLKKDNPRVRATLSFLCTAVAASSSSRFSVNDVAAALSGLQPTRCGDDTAEVYAMISLLADKIEASAAVDHSSRDIVACLDGLKSFGCRDSSVRKILQSLVPKISFLHQKYCAKHIALSMESLSCMSDRVEPVRSVLHALTDHLAAINKSVPDKYLLKYLHNLKSMHHCSDEALKFISVVVNHLERADVVSSPKEICSAIFGLQGKCESDVIIQLLGVLSSALRASPDTFSVSSVGAALFGLSTIGDHVVVNEIRVFLSEKLLTCTDNMTPLDLRHIMASLRKRPMSDPSNKHLALSLTSILRRSQRIALDARTIGQCMRGLQNLDSSTPEAQCLIKAIAMMLDDSELVIPTNAALRTISCLRAMNVHVSEVQELIYSLAMKLQSSTGQYVMEDVAASFNAVGNLSLVDDRETVSHMIRLLASKAEPYIPQFKKRGLNVPVGIEKVLQTVEM